MDRQGLAGSSLLQKLYDKLDKTVRIKLDRMGVWAGQDPGSDPDPQVVRKELLLQLLAFWDEAILIDKDGLGRPGWRSDFYHVQRALCLARLREHQRAAEAANSVDPAAWLKSTPHQSEFELAKRYDLARVYALCAAVTRDKGEMAEQYCQRAMTYLRAAAEAGYFKEAAHAQCLEDDRDLAFLRPRDDFGKLLRDVKP